MTDIARALQSLGATDWALDGDDIAGLTWLGGEPQFTTEQILAAAAGQAQADLVAYAADRRWRRETGGATWNGWPIHTDVASQGKYLAELQAISLGARVDADPWKFADGVFRPVANADFADLAISARAHVRHAFAIEGVVVASIANGEITSLAEVDAAFA